MWQEICTRFYTIRRYWWSVLILCHQGVILDEETGPGSEKDHEVPETLQTQVTHSEILLSDIWCSGPEIQFKAAGRLSSGSRSWSRRGSWRGEDWPPKPCLHFISWRGNTEERRRTERQKETERCLIIVLQVHSQDRREVSDREKRRVRERSPVTERSLTPRQLHSLPFLCLSVSLSVFPPAWMCPSVCSFKELHYERHAALCSVLQAFPSSEFVASLLLE